MREGKGGKRTWRDGRRGCDKEWKGEAVRKKMEREGNEMVGRGKGGSEREDERRKRDRQWGKKIKGRERSRRSWLTREKGQGKEGKRNGGTRKGSEREGERREREGEGGERWEGLRADKDRRSAGRG